MNNKVIINNCSLCDECIMKIDGKYFGYDEHPQYPETRYEDINKAYIFKNQSDALSMTSWLTGEKFTLIPIKYRKHKTNKELRKLYLSKLGKNNPKMSQKEIIGDTVGNEV